MGSAIAGLTLKENSAKKRLVRLTVWIEDHVLKGSVFVIKVLWAQLANTRAALTTVLHTASATKESATVSRAGRVQIVRLSPAPVTAQATVNV